ncbi:MAG: aminotransferase [Sphingomonas sp.]|nr:MAG: aminotransferase [Sphingomonas sp.]
MQSPNGDATASRLEATAPSPTSEPIYVTRPQLPPLADLIPYLEEIWENQILTNGGPFHQQLEEELCAHLGVPYISLFSNGTLGLISALQALRITGEVITTPYSFVATAHSLLWHGNQPVFVDVEPHTLNIDPGKIESAITPRTSAIMPVHCYGNPCNVEEIGKIADNYNLKTIYDSAHSFGVQDNGGSILRHGDLSVLSFHATKVFNTFEGGAIISHDAKMKRIIDNLKNFGIVSEISVVAPGINAKMNEFSAAFGLLQIQQMDYVLRRRREVDALYRDRLSNVRGIECLPRGGQKTDNHAYFPILVKNEFGVTRDVLYERLRHAGIYSRRYFYPLLSNLSMYRGLPSADPALLPVANAAAREILCLPIYPGLQLHEQIRIVDQIVAIGRSG